MTSARPRLLLQDHHHALTAAGTDLRVEIYGDDTLTLIHRFRCFEHAIAEHLDVEERELLPDFTLQAPAEAATIQRQHRELRDRLYQLGVEVELHRARAETLEALVELLHRHLAYEETTLYPWAQSHVSLRARRELFVRLGHSLRRLARLPRRAA